MAKGSVALAKIPPPNRIQLREALNTDAVEEYADRMREGDELPPVVVFVGDDGQWLAEGNHRVAAAEKVGLDSIACDFRRGDRTVATLHAASANQGHGVRRSNADKRRAAAAVLELEPEWSDRRIAEHVGVGNQLVGHVRAQLCESHSSPQPTERVGSDGKKRKAPEPNPSAAESKFGRDENAEQLDAELPYVIDEDLGYCDDCGAEVCVCDAGDAEDGDDGEGFDDVAAAMELGEAIDRFMDSWPRDASLWEAVNQIERQARKWRQRAERRDSNESAA